MIIKQSANMEMFWGALGFLLLVLGFVTAEFFDKKKFQ